MPSPSIRIKKNADGSVALTLTRADGSTTWQRQDAKRARHFVFHDLTHFAVESVLACPEGFYGLVAAGWSIPDFEDGTDDLPDAAIRVETVVGLLDMERADEQVLRAEEFNAQAALHYESRGDNGEPPVVTESQLGEIRRLRDELFSRWASVKVGESLELRFQPDS